MVESAMLWSRSRSLYEKNIATFEPPPAAADARISSRLGCLAMLPRTKVSPMSSRLTSGRTSERFEIRPLCIADDWSATLGTRSTAFSVLAAVFAYESSSDAVSSTYCVCASVSSSSRTMRGDSTTAVTSTSFGAAPGKSRPSAVGRPARCSATTAARVSSSTV